METLPDFIPIGDSDDGEDPDTSALPSQPLRRSLRLLRASGAEDVDQSPTPSTRDPQAAGDASLARDDDVQNSLGGHHSVVIEMASGFSNGKEGLSQPLRRPLDIRQPEADVALVLGGVERPKIQPQPDFIALLDSEVDEVEDAITQPLRRSARLRQAGGDATHPWRHRRQHKLISRRTAFRPRQARSKGLAPQPALQTAVQDKGSHPGQPPDEEVWLKMYTASHKSINLGVCSLCGRTIHNITAHHVHPRVGGNRRGPAGFTEEQLGKHVPACLSCHRIIHHFIPNDIMGMSYYSVELLRSHPRVMAWIKWVVLQPLPKPPTSPGKAVPRLTRRQMKKAKRQQNRSINQETKRRTDHPIPAIRRELKKIWAENGNTFPRWSRDSDTARTRRRELVERLRSRANTTVNIPKLQKAMKPVPEYREWYLWIFDSTRVKGVTVNTPNTPRAVAGPQTEIEVEAAGARSITGVADVISGAMDALAGAVEVIDLTGDDDAWVDMDGDEEVQGKIVIDLTGDDTDEV